MDVTLSGMENMINVTTYKLTAVITMEIIVRVFNSFAHICIYEHIAKKILLFTSDEKKLPLIKYEYSFCVMLPV
jgi:hypothetical protein